MKWYKKLLYWGFCENYWGWFHSLAGGTFALSLTITSFLTIIIVPLVFLIALMWEFIEFYIECGGSWQRVIAIYGSRERYLYDCVGDIILACLCATLVVIGRS